MVTAELQSASKRFKDNLTVYLKAQEEYKREVTSKVERQLKIAYPDVAQSEIKEL